MNIRAQLISDTLGLQCELYNFQVIYKEVEREVLSQTPARVPTGPSHGASCHMVRKRGKIKV